MILAIAAALAIAMLAFAFLIRESDLTHEPAATPWNHLEGRKASIYENLRDLQFEYRLGKLSDDDYSRSKTELQSELATILSEIETLKAAPADSVTPKPSKRKAAGKFSCPHCKATFDKSLKFCGDCGKPMEASA
ncbi:MAG: hypothetical protein H7039_00950 [Bryobacteraceae bacterium]|nr:hypothetical protein [Bryobacteraceae bacterium]